MHSSWSRQLFEFIQSVKVNFIKTLVLYHRRQRPVLKNGYSLRLEDEHRQLAVPLINERAGPFWQKV